MNGGCRGTFGVESAASLNRGDKTEAVLAAAILAAAVLFAMKHEGDAESLPGENLLLPPADDLERADVLSMPARPH